MAKFNFNFKLPSFIKHQTLSLGLDIGSHSIKICELNENDNGLELISLGSAVLPPGAVEDGELQDPETVGAVIKALVKNLNIKGRKAAISISGYSVIMKKVNLTVMTEAELTIHIQEEAEQYIPFEIDEVYLDFQDLHTNTENEERTDVMLVAAKKEVINGYLEMLQSAGLKTVIVDVDAFALENGYESNYGNEGNVLLVDIGSAKMNINIIDHGISIFARDIVMGSRQLSEEIQGRFGLSFEEAESLKLGSTPPEDKQEEIEEIFSNICTQWIMEIKKALDFYNSNFPDSPIEKMVLSGGGSKVKGLDHFFADEIGMPVEIFDPFANTKVDTDKIDPAYLSNIAPEMAIAMGLATRAVPF